ncbi:MAG: NAD(P)-dependent alcohol dehydrogenase [Stellaceae bacterium]
MRIRAAVATAPDAPFEIAACDLGEPQAGEVLVRVHACGICHTDLAVKLQHIPVPLPRVLGHEGAGIVERVGPGVSHVQAGDHVLMSFGSCGLCANCAAGAPGYCDHFRSINLFGERSPGPALSRDGAALGGHFFAQSAFATYAIATARNVVKIAGDLPLELLAPLGCGIQTGMGSVMLALAPAAGTSIAIFGAGSVGLAAVIAARIVGCTTIIAVDVKENRLRLARDIGATHVIDGRGPDIAGEIVKLTGRGAHFSFDTTGVPAVVASSVKCLRARGQSAQVAAPPRGTQYCVEASTLIAGGITLRGVVEGDATPAAFIPTMIEFYRKGMLPLAALVRTYPFDRINQAVEDMETGDVVKPVLVMA